MKSAALWISGLLFGLAIALAIGGHIAAIGAIIGALCNLAVWKSK